MLLPDELITKIHHAIGQKNIIELDYNINLFITIFPHLTHHLNVFKYLIEKSDIEYDPLLFADRYVNLEWTAIITLFKRKNYIKQQLDAIINQSIPPKEIFIIINGSYITCHDIKKMNFPNIQIISSDINSLYTRWIMGYNAQTDYIFVFDDDIIPGKYWAMNALRCMIKYNALIGSTGRKFDTCGRHKFFKEVLHEENQNKDIACDWICNSYLFKKEWIKYAVTMQRYKDQFMTYDDIQLAASLNIFANISCYVPMQPDSYEQLKGSLYEEYGADMNAVWRISNHNNFRRDYVYELVAKGFSPLGIDKLKYSIAINSIKVSVIIPVYNRDKIIKNCLESVINQSFKNIEIVIYDDGSTDSTLSVIKKIVNNGNHIIIHNKLNMGPGFARNRAIEVSSGNYITFLDSDDYYCDKFYIERCIRFMLVTKCDCLITPYIRKFKSKQVVDAIKINSGPQNDAHNKYLNREYGTHAPGGKIFSRNLVNNMHFSEYGYSEDVIFCYRVIKNSISPYLVNFTGYMHVKDNESAWNPNKIQAIHIYSSFRFLLELLLLNLHEDVNLSIILDMWAIDHGDRIQSYINENNADLIILFVNNIAVKFPFIFDIIHLRNIDRINYDNLHIDKYFTVDFINYYNKLCKKLDIPQFNIQ